MGACVIRMAHTQQCIGIAHFDSITALMARASLDDQKGSLVP